MIVFQDLLRFYLLSLYETLFNVVSQPCTHVLRLIIGTFVLVT